MDSVKEYKSGTGGIRTPLNDRVKRVHWGVWKAYKFGDQMMQLQKEFLQAKFKSLDCEPM